MEAGAGRVQGEGATLVVMMRTKVARSTTAAAQTLEQFRQWRRWLSAAAAAARVAAARAAVHGGWRAERGHRYPNHRYPSMLDIP